MYIHSAWYWNLKALNIFLKFNQNMVLVDKKKIHWSEEAGS